MALISCPECGRQVSDAAPACPTCGYPLHRVAVATAPVAAAPPIEPAVASAAPPKPIAGIVVGGVLSAYGVLSGLIAMGRLDHMAQNFIVQSVPALMPLKLLGLALGLLVDTCVLIGVLLALAGSRAGHRVVRIASIAALVVFLPLAMLGLLVVMGSPAWSGFSGPLSAAFVGAVVGGMVGTVVQFGLLLYLFRRSRYP